LVEFKSTYRKWHFGQVGHGDKKNHMGGFLLPNSWLEKPWFLVMPLSKNNFHVNPIVQDKMAHLRTYEKYELSLVSFQKFQRETIIIQSLNTHSLKLHFVDFLTYWNIFAYHILCLNETKIKNIHINLNIYTTILENFHIISCYDRQDTMILYNKTMILSKLTTITHFGLNSSLQHLTRTHMM